MEISNTSRRRNTPVALQVEPEDYTGRLVSVALAAGHHMLSEADSKSLLAYEQFRVVQGQLVGSRRGALSAAGEIGFPVVLKASGHAITHKTDRGLIESDIRSRSALLSSYKNIKAALAKHGLEGMSDGLLVEKMLAPATELILGFRRDPSYGPIVMVGVGGIFTEFIRDVSFGLVPVTVDDVWRMLRSLRLFPLLEGGQRGLPKNDLDSVVQVVFKIAGHDGVASKLKECFELDINPICLYPKGCIIADAKIYLERATLQPRQVRAPMSDAEIITMFQPLFYPKSAAYVGASPNNENMVTRMMQASDALGFKGPVFPIHPNAELVAGRRAYRSLEELPESVDFACIGIAAEKIPTLFAATTNKVKFAHVLSSGFSELGDHGRELEIQLLAAARQAGVRILGPNCMGLYCPEGKISCIDHASPVAGRVGFVSQSGGFGTDAIRRANALGLAFSKVVTVGNSIDLECSDFIEYFAVDPSTDAILVYVESFQDGRRFFDTCRIASATKPLFILRGGLSLQGSRAAQSHTGRLSGGREEWTSLLRQTGAVTVDSLEELLYAGLVVQHKALPRGPRVLLCGQGGGASVVATDWAARCGLKVPELDRDTLAQVEGLNLPPGTSRNNPIDAPVGTLQVENGGLFERLVDVVCSTANFDAVILHINLQNVVSYAPEPAKVIERFVATAAAVRGRGLFVVFVPRTSGEPFLETYRAAALKLAWNYKLPALPEIKDALMALATAYRYAQPDK